MMTSEGPRCNRCKTPIQSQSYYCISCFRALHRPCPRCMERQANGRWDIRRKGRARVPVDCEWCDNERFVSAEEEKENAPSCYPS
jgi:hypothetical protein